MFHKKQALKQLHRQKNNKVRDFNRFAGNEKILKHIAVSLSTEQGCFPNGVYDQILSLPVLNLHLYVIKMHLQFIIINHPITQQ